jgi:ABC-type oligopeptide transport system substrate-binding subunit
MSLRLLLALLASIAATTAGAAVIPPGTQLSPGQEVVRNNGAEPESLDPAHTETVNATEIGRDLFEGLTSTDHQGNVVSGVRPAGDRRRGLAGAQPTRYDWADWPMDKRVAEARRLLAQAGVKPGTRLKFTYNNSDYHKKMAIFAASEWKTKLGLDTDIDSLEFKVLIRKRHDGDFQIARNGWVFNVNDATTLLNLAECDSDFNDDHSCNRAADALIAQAKQLTDPARRAALLRQAARMMAEDYPMIPLLQYTAPRLVKPWVGGYGSSGGSGGTNRYRSKDFYIVRH